MLFKLLKEPDKQTFNRIDCKHWAPNYKENQIVENIWIDNEMQMTTALFYTMKQWL